MKDEGLPEKASEWLATLAERSGDQALRDRFNDWLNADPAHLADWIETSRTYDLIGLVEPAHPHLWEDHARPALAAVPPAATTESRRRRRFGRPSQQVAAAWAAALAACLALFVLLPDLSRDLGADHVTGTGELQTVALPDGSTLRLGPDSAADVSFSTETRGITLRDGIAFLEIVTNPERPFHVDLGGHRVTVIGTAFEIRRDGPNRGVAVREGVVRVTTAGGTTPIDERLAAGMTLSIEGGRSLRGRIPPDQVAAWLDGRLIARDLPVGRVVDEIRHYLDGTVFLIGDTLSSRPVTGLYDLTRPRQALRAVADAQGARLYQITPWITVIASP